MKYTRLKETLPPSVFKATYSDAGNKTYNEVNCISQVNMQALEVIKPISYSREYILGFSWKGLKTFDSFNV